MVVLTGPQGSAEEVGDLIETAGLMGWIPAPASAAIVWADVTELYRVAGWDTCPLAVADVAVAQALDIPIKDMPDW